MKRASTMIAMTLLLAGCAEGRLNVGVDLLSFMSDSERTIAYGPIPGGVTGVSVRNTPQVVELLDGIGSIVALESVRLFGTAELDNVSGNATFEFRIFLSDQSDPFLEMPAIVVTGTVTPGQTTAVSFDEMIPDQLVSIFEKSTVYVGVEAVFDSAEPFGGANVQGNILATRLEGQIAGVEDIFGDDTP